MMDNKKKQHVVKSNMYNKKKTHSEGFYKQRIGDIL